MKYLSFVTWHSTRKPRKKGLLFSALHIHDFWRSICLNLHVLGFSGIHTTGTKAAKISLHTSYTTPLNSAEDMVKLVSLASSASQPRQGFICANHISDLGEIYNLIFHCKLHVIFSENQHHFIYAWFPVPHASNSVRKHCQLWQPDLICSIPSTSDHWAESLTLTQVIEFKVDCLWPPSLRSLKCTYSLLPG